MTLTLGEVAAAISSASARPRTTVSGFSVDSRTIAPGNLFFALRGLNHDGHAFLSQVFAAGATAAVVEPGCEAEGILLQVPDTYAALGELGRFARGKLQGTVVAVTGSAGKTTTKDAIAHLLSARMATGKTAGNFNNHVGLPLSILRLPDDCRVAVLEIGMNHPGEIARLAEIARPQVGVVTNVGFAHVEHFDSIEGVALAKRELIEALPPDGAAVLNADDPRVAAFGIVHQGPVVTFGFSETADVRAEEMAHSACGTRFRVQGAGWFETPLEGRHAVSNLLAALAVARVFGFALEELADLIRTFEAGPGRGRRLARNGITILDDCYNANPEAMRAMLDTLRDAAGRRRIAVLGEMLELGRLSESLHREIGRYAASTGIDLLVGIRGSARVLVEAAVEAGLPPASAVFFEDPDQAGHQLRELVSQGDVVLFKGSRGTRVEKALERFLG